MPAVRSHRPTWTRLQSGRIGADASHTWLLAYSADDTAALAAIRDEMNQS